MGALLLGVCIALKGYALILVPAFFVFCLYQIGLRSACIAAVFILLPTLASNLGVFLWSGMQALLAPYKRQAYLQVLRGFNGESSFDSLFFVGSHLGLSQNRISHLSSWLLKHHLPQITQALAGLAAGLFRPSRFENFLDAALLSILGFMTFSPCYSPQWFLWVVPFLLLTEDRILLFLGIFLGWSSYIYWLNCDRYNLTYFAVSVLLVTTTRVFMMAEIVKKFATKNDSPVALGTEVMEAKGRL